VIYVYLIRHAANDFLGSAIAGWKPGVRLNAEGLAQAERLARFLKNQKLDQIYSSPLERAQETALPSARELHLEVRTAPEIGELNFGDWTGKSFEELAGDARWQKWNQHRSTCRTPGGERMLEVQARFVGLIERLHTEQDEKKIALFSHGDPIRSAVLYYLGLPIDFFDRIELSPASVSLLELHSCRPRFLYINQTVY